MSTWSKGRAGKRLHSLGQKMSHVDKFLFPGLSMMRKNLFSTTKIKKIYKNKGGMEYAPMESEEQRLK